MIDYDGASWKWAFTFICRMRGSVFPAALYWAVPSSVLGFFIPHLVYTTFGEEYPLHSNLLLAVWTSLTGMLGFLLVFRTQTAYGRYSEGADLLRNTRTHWFNAASSLIAFSSRDTNLQVDVERFQHLLVRLMSLLNCYSLQMIADTDSEVFVVISLEGISLESLDFLTSKKDRHHRCEIIIQWIQKLVVEAIETNVICVPSPITTRFFQELSLGATNINKARNLGPDLPFPFPYAQMIALFLLLHWLSTPVIVGVVLQAGISSALLTFCAVFAFQGINRIATVIESPYGMDLNDLPLALMQEDFNSSLWILLENQMEFLPEFQFTESCDHRDWMLQEVRTSKGTGVTHHSSLRSGENWVTSQSTGGRSNKRGSFFAKQSLGADAAIETWGLAPRVGTSVGKSNPANPAHGSSGRSTPSKYSSGSASRSAVLRSALSKYSKSGTLEAVSSEPAEPQRSDPMQIAPSQQTQGSQGSVLASIQSSLVHPPTLAEACTASAADVITSNHSTTQPTISSSQPIIGSDSVASGACPMISVAQSLDNAKINAPRTSRTSRLKSLSGTSSLGRQWSGASSIEPSPRRRQFLQGLTRGDSFDRLKEQMLEFGDIMREVSTTLRVLVEPGGSAGKLNQDMPRTPREASRDQISPSGPVRHATQDRVPRFLPSTPELLT